jgi:hypothetical protein
MRKGLGKGEHMRSLKRALSRLGDAIMHLSGLRWLQIFACVCFLIAGVDAWVTRPADLSPGHYREMVYALQDASPGAVAIEVDRPRRYLFIAWDVPRRAHSVASTAFRVSGRSVTASEFARVAADTEDLEDPEDWKVIDTTLTASGVLDEINVRPDPDIQGAEIRLY